MTLSLLPIRSSLASATMNSFTSSLCSAQSSTLLPDNAVGREQTSHHAHTHMIQSHPGVALRLLEFWTNAATSFNSNNYDETNQRSATPSHNSVCLSDILATVLQLCISSLTPQPATSILFAAAFDTLDAVTHTFRKYLLPPQVGNISIGVIAAYHHAPANPTLLITDSYLSHTLSHIDPYI